MKDYKQKYEEALELMKDCIPDKDGLVHIRPCEIFPELKESEDERIRKWLIEIVEEVRKANPNNASHNGNCSDAIAWLEKQGEEKIVTNVLIKAGLKPYKDGNKWCILVGDNIQEGICGFGDTVDEALFEFLKELVEKQGEQKTTDNAEPKFKVGDWVRAISSGNIFKILSVNDGLYHVLCYDGVEANYPIEDVDYDLAYWTIEDAKDGDVLLFEGNYNSIVLFQGIGINGAGHINYYCKCDLGNYSFSIQGDVAYLGTIENSAECYHPATKEQRDLFFSKMKEAGYEWDAGKKELKKLNKKVMSDKEKAHQIAWETSKHYDPLLSKESWCEMAALDMASWKNEQKLTEWSDKDWYYYNKLESFLEVKDHYSPTESSSGYQKDVHETLTWLKSLRPNKHVTWSEEDERKINEFIESLEYCNGKGYNKQITWLKSLKERHTWKPTDEQMKALEKVRVILHNPNIWDESNPILYQYEELMRDLMKLREE